MRPEVLLAAVVAALGLAACATAAPSGVAPPPAAPAQKDADTVACDAGEDKACVRLALWIFSRTAPNAARGFEILSASCERGGWWSCRVLESQWDRTNTPRPPDFTARMTQRAEIACRQKREPDACGALIELTRPKGRALFELQLMASAPDWAATAVSDAVRECAAPAGTALILSGDVEALTRTIGSCAQLLDEYAPRIRQMRDELGRSKPTPVDAGRGEPEQTRQVEDDFREACQVLQERLSVHDVTVDERSRQGLLGRAVKSSTCEGLGLRLRTWDYAGAGGE
jgi:hypothetical protein